MCNQSDGELRTNFKRLIEGGDGVRGGARMWTVRHRGKDGSGQAFSLVTTALT
jgi:hypothetical protein